MQTLSLYGQMQIVEQQNKDLVLNCEKKIGKKFQLVFELSFFAYFSFCSMLVPFVLHSQVSVYWIWRKLKLVGTINHYN